MSNNRSMFSIGDSTTAFIVTPTTQPEADSIAFLLKDPAHSTLKELHLGVETFNQETIDKVTQALKESKTLTKLEVKGDKKKPANPVSFRSNAPAARPETKAPKKEAVILEKIFLALRSNTTLAKLHIENANLNHEHTIHQLNMMLKDNKTLNTLTLKNCSLAGKIGDLTCISQNTGLRVLELPDNNLSTRDLEFFALGMKTSTNPGNQHLIKIDLTDSSSSKHTPESAREKCLASITNATKRNEKIQRNEEKYFESIEEARLKDSEELKNSAQHKQSKPIASSNPKSGYAFARLLGGTIGSLASGAICIGAIALTIGFGGLLAAGPIGWAILGGIVVAGAVCGVLMGDVIAEHRAAVREQTHQAIQSRPMSESTQKTMDGLNLAGNEYKHKSNLAKSTDSSALNLDIATEKKSKLLPQKVRTTNKDRTGANILIDSDSEDSFEDLSPRRRTRQHIVIPAEANVVSAEPGSFQFNSGLVRR